MKTFGIVIEAPDYEQTLYIEEPDDATEDSVREKYSQNFTVYEVWEEDETETE